VHEPAERLPNVWSIFPRTAAMAPVGEALHSEHPESLAPFADRVLSYPKTLRNLLIRNTLSRGKNYSGTQGDGLRSRWRPHEPP